MALPAKGASIGNYRSCTSHRPTRVFKQSKLPGGDKGTMLAVGVTFAQVAGMVALLAERGQVACEIVGGMNRSI